MPLSTRTLADRLRGTRLALGLKQAEVGERVGIAPEVYGRIERGETTPRLGTFVRVCEALQIRPGDLLDGQVSLPRNSGVSSELRQLLAVLDVADGATIKRVTEFARVLMASTSPKRHGRRRSSQR